MKIIEYTPELKEHIKNLNIECLEKYFSVEPNDLVQFSDPENEIINKGGFIFYTSFDSIIIGTISLMKVDEFTYELSKMAVSEKYQGVGTGGKILRYTIEFAKRIGANKLILYSNTKLIPAISLYKKHGFVELPMTNGHYKRANIKMELILI